MIDQPDSSPPPGRSPAPAPEPSGKPVPEGSGGPKPKHRHRALVWSLIVLASVVLVVSLVANWVQTEALDTNQVEEYDRPDPRRPRRPAGARHLHGRPALRQRRRPGPDREGAAERRQPLRRSGLGGDPPARHQRGREGPRLAAGSGPRLHRGGRAQKQFVSLIEDKDAYVSTTGGTSPSSTGASSPTSPPASGSTRRRSPRSRASSRSTRPTSAGADQRSDQHPVGAGNPLPGAAGKLGSQAKQDLQTLNKNAAKLKQTISTLKQKINGVQGKVPAQLQGRLSDLEGRLSDLERPAVGTGATERRGAQESRPAERREARRLARPARALGSRPCSTARSCRPPASSS